MPKQLLGQAFMQPYEEATRAQSNRAMTQNREMRTQLMPQQVAQRQNYQNARIQNMQQRIQQMQGTLKLNRDRFNESVRQFNELLPYREKQMSMGGARAPAVLQMQNDALQIAQQFGAIDKDGNVDPEKIPAVFRQRYNTDMLYAQKSGMFQYSAKRINQMKNALDTVNSIDTKPLEHYSGKGGAARLAIDQKLPASQQPEIYNQYEKIVNTAIPYAAEQIGQAFGGSVQKEAMEVRSRSLTDPRMRSNPDIVRKQIDYMKQLVSTELANNLNQALNPSFFGSLTGNPSDNFTSNPQLATPESVAQANNVHSSEASKDITTSKGNVISESEIKQFAQQKGISESQATAFIMSNY